jgi:DNA repair exonuclease SbcCD ATPase subunit
MGSIFVVVGFFLIVVALVVKIDGLTKEHKRLLSQFKMRDQEASHVQQLTYELAEECCQMLLLQLNQERAATRFNPTELAHIEQLCQAIPVICRELVLRPQPIAQALQRYCKKYNGDGYTELEVFINRHGRLISSWQKNTFAGYLQLCQAAVILVKELSSTESTKTVRPKPEMV